MQSAIFFIFYFIVLVLALTILVRKKQISLSFSAITFIYAYKVLFGCIYGYIFLRFYRGDDTWMYHRESLLQYQKLFHHPIEFFKDFLPYPAFNASHDFWQGMQFYIQDLEYWMMVKLLAIFNIFSRGNYYINVLFFDFIACIGIILLYKLLLTFYPARKKILIAILFFMPLTTFWLSGIRAEAVLLLFIALILYYSNKWFNNRKKIIYLIYVMSGLTGCLILRAQLLIVFIPAFFCMTITWRKPQRAIYYFAAVYIVCITVFFGSMLVSPEKNLSMPVIKRQQEFFRLQANTSFKLDSLQPEAMSFVKILPQAFSNTFLRPFVWEAKGILQLLTAIDILFFWLLVLFAILFYEKGRKKVFQNPLILLFVFSGVSQVIFIGYIVPFPGAIVRYKSIPELFLLLTIVLITDYDIIISFLKKREGRHTK